MCLATVKWAGESVEDSVEITGIGYKLFRVDKHGHLKGQHFCFDGSFRRNRWIKDNGTGGIDYYVNSEERFKQYPRGFHIYMTYEGAKANQPSCDSEIVLKKVMFRQVVAFGQQSCESVVIAREIKILD